MTRPINSIIHGLNGVVVAQEASASGYATASFAQRLNELYQMTVKEGQNRDTVISGQVLTLMTLLPSGYQ